MFRYPIGCSGLRKETNSRFYRNIDGWAKKRNRRNMNTYISHIEGIFFIITLTSLSSFDDVCIFIHANLNYPLNPQYTVFAATYIKLLSTKTFVVFPSLFICCEIVHLDFVQERWRVTVCSIRKKEKKLYSRVIKEIRKGSA